MAKDKKASIELSLQEAQSFLTVMAEGCKNNVDAYAQVYVFAKQKFHEAFNEKDDPK